MSLVTTTGFARTMNVPFNLSQASLNANTAEQVVVITITRVQQLQLRWLAVHLVKMNASPVQAPTKVNPSLGTVYAGLYGDRAEFVTAPAGRPLVYVPVELPGVNQAPPAFSVLNLNPGTYAILVVNNLLDATVEVAVTGSYRVTL